MLTSCVDVKVCGFVCHIACGLQTWSPGLDFARVPQSFCHIHCVRALVNVLACKQHFHLMLKEKNKTNLIQSQFYPAVTVCIVKTHNKYYQWALTL